MGPPKSKNFSINRICHSLTLIVKIYLGFLAASMHQTANWRFILQKKWKTVSDSEVFGFTIYKEGRNGENPYPAFLRAICFFYCTKLSKFGCNLFRSAYSMMAPTRNATTSAMTSDQTTPWKPFI